MKIGLIDVDGHNFPNLPLMKISAYHKKKGDEVEWYSAVSGMILQYDKVYMSKVFSFTPDYQFPIFAKEIERGGSGYCIDLVNGKEVYHKERDRNLPQEIEHIYPDYSLYPEMTKDTAYGFLTRGCPRGCEFCHVAKKEGRCSIKVADLSEFWNGQKRICLLDANITACKDWKELFQQLIDSRAYVDFSQGLDARLLTEEKIEMLKKIKVGDLHLAFDRIEDKDLLVPIFRNIKNITGWSERKLNVYVLVGDKERYVTEGDLFRLYFLRETGFTPYVMIYDKEHLPVDSDLKKLQRWVNNKRIWGKCERFEDYEKQESDTRQISIW